MTTRNFLLGRGERLTSDVVVPSGPVIKVPPYTVQEARTRLMPMLDKTTKAFAQLPEKACPDEQVIAAFTMNPEYIAKSYYPHDLLRKVGLEAVGSKPRTITPEKRSRAREPQEAITTQLFVTGKRAAFQTWALELPKWSLTTLAAEQLASIEQISAPRSKDKIKGRLPRNGKVVYEVVLHTDELLGESKTLPHFREYLADLGIETDLKRRFYAGGLCFVELVASAEHAEEITQYVPVRVLRQMPKLRFLRPPIRAGAVPAQRVKLPDVGPLDPSIRVAVFDGGVPREHPLTRWTRPHEPRGLTTAMPDDLEHGIGVTSALLFGHLDPSQPIPPPYCNVDHYRVLDETPGQDPGELYEVLERIHAVLTQEPTYQFMNFSLGPILPVDDDDVHAWTSLLDEYLADGEKLATIAVGNTGESDKASGLNRIQVPADCVNALAIGAANSPGKKWKRAPYSSVGPGRSPGVIKPDMVEFGGSLQRPFLVIAPTKTPQITSTGGTSFAAPSVLRLGVGLRAHFGPVLDALAIKALLIHTAEPGEGSAAETGRGRLARTLDDLILCADDTVRVVYRGAITPAKYIRAPLPMPTAALIGRLKVHVTLCYACEVDPHHPGNYTRSGLEATFRPHSGKRKTSSQTHADSRSFFGKAQRGMTEGELRSDAWKWENCQHASHTFNAASLSEPVFDIHYNSRREGYNHKPTTKLPYALIVTVQAPQMADLYNQVVRRYATQLEAFRPVIEIPVRT